MTVKKELAGVVAGAALLAFASGTGAASADPPLNAGPHQQPAELLHHHYIITGSGDCMVLQAPMFIFDTRGLHNGANKSSGAEPPADLGLADQRGPWHHLPQFGFGCPEE